MIMAQPIPEPDPQTLVPPLLAYLPTSFASSRPPPSLLPLLSPILRQRLHVLTGSSSDSHESWVRLLCWDGAKADKLKDIVENANFEPHPVSGEVEVGELDTITYRRFDYETLKVHIPLADWDLSAVYLWCTGSDEGDGWRLAELLPFESDWIRDSAWSRSIQEAESASRQTNAALCLQTYGLTVPGKPSTANGGDDDDYWAMYDNTPGPTPARATANPRGQSTNEEDYYARYGSVQPALDSHDPDEEHEELEESSLNGNALQEMLAKNSKNGRWMETTATNGALETPRPEPEEQMIPVRQPTPSSPRSRASTDTIEKLEDEAERYAASEIGIRQHISYSIKSMYRLAKSAGIGRSEFEDMVQRELETLSILDLDDL